ncbi:hypothetical protein DL96DRAFT_1709589 [Flagelloscypha sp. PMI_526]|nr:hypothetical protein DL96DRAFT_1709589 [Flagelloscypha sp. PMI_526]
MPLGDFTPVAELAPDEPRLRVLLTGFEPLPLQDVSPSWVAVEPLHNKLIRDPVDEEISQMRPIHITTLQLPTTYAAIQDIVPRFHKMSTLPYDFILHVGSCGRGPLRLERLAHRTGYMMKGTLRHGGRPRTDGPEQDCTRTRTTWPEGVVPLVPNDPSAPEPPPRAERRGFGPPRYDNHPEELITQLDVQRLVSDLKESGEDRIYTSMDAAHYLCDYAYFCSLAEADRHYKFDPKHQYNKRRTTYVLALHTPPPDQPLSTQAVTEAIKRIVVWACQEIENEDMKAQAEEEAALRAAN